VDFLGVFLKKEKNFSSFLGFILWSFIHDFLGVFLKKEKNFSSFLGFILWSFIHDVYF